MKTDVLIIGGGIAGTTAAETFRAGNPDATVTIVTDEEHPLYSRVLLPHVVKGKTSEEKVFLKGEGFYADNGIVYMTGRTVTGIDPERKHAVLGEGEVITYGKLVIATGGQPRDWDVPGADLGGILRLQTYEDIESVKDHMKEGEEMVIVGTGFIAMEFAAFAVHFGMKATVLNRGPHFCSSVFGPEMGRHVADILASKGVEVIHDARVERVLGEGQVKGVRLVGGREIACSVIGLGIGIAVDTGPFKGLGTNVGVVTDENLETAFEDVWAAGDCAEFMDPLLGLRHIAGNWTNAMAQGRHVGQALLGDRKPFSALTAYTSMCFPGAALIHLGVTRAMPDIVRETVELDEGKVIELHRFDGRAVGAVLLNAPERRAALTKAIAAGDKTPLAELIA